MSKRIPLEGRRFGRLLVEKFLGSKKYGTAGYTKSHYSCKCDCGASITAEANNLKSGNTSSCGCVRTENRSGDRSNLFTGGKMLAQYRREVRVAGLRKLEFTLTQEQVVAFFKQSCYYCSAAPRPDTRGIVRSGMDRVDNSIGYTLENIVSCCSDCNIAKHDQSKPEFLNQVKRIYEKHFKSGNS